jgi:UDP-N-acetylglucosamine 1-carboxyvinyltransferase
MERFVITGGNPLSGKIPISGAKNSALPTCVASLLTDEEVVIEHVPRLRDVTTILSMISSLGKVIEQNEQRVRIVGKGKLSYEARAKYVEQMRASFLVLGPLVARLGRAVIPLPGGCRIGARPVDLHLLGLKKLGAQVKQDKQAVTVVAKRLRGTSIHLPFPSVGATEQILMSAALADGETVIGNPAWEPEVIDLVSLLRKMGSEIEYKEGALYIQGRDDLHGASHMIIPDRMEAGTYLLAAAITRGTVEIEPVIPDNLRLLLSILSQIGCLIEETSDSLRLTMRERPSPINLVTAPYPGFPTDLQPPIVVLLSLADGKSVVREGVFENRFGYVPALREMGARIQVKKNSAIIQGVSMLKAMNAPACDIRAGAALVLAALAAEGSSQIYNLAQIDRGYEQMAEKLSRAEVQIERVN